jgi:hypothetical protein
MRPALHTRTIRNEDIADKTVIPHPHSMRPSKFGSTVQCRCQAASHQIFEATTSYYQVPNDEVRLDGVPVNLPPTEARTSWDYLLFPWPCGESSLRSFGVRSVVFAVKDFESVLRACGTLGFYPLLYVWGTWERIGSGEDSGVMASIFSQSPVVGW